MLYSALASWPLLAAETDDKELGFWFEAQAVSGKNPSRFIGWYQRDLTDSFGFFAQVGRESDSYRQFYAGPTWKPATWLELGIGIGRETVPGEFTATRRGFYFDANWQKVNVFGTLESGGSGRWHKVTATYALNEHFGVGVMKETGLGSGARLEYNIRIRNEEIQLWGATLRDKKTTSVLGVNFSF